MNGPDYSPLDDSHCACLDRVLQQAAQTEQLIQACADCGLDHADDLRRVQAQAELARRIKAKFFPGRP